MLLGSSLLDQDRTTIPSSAEVSTDAAVSVRPLAADEQAFLDAVYAEDPGLSEADLLDMADDDARRNAEASEPAAPAFVVGVNVKGRRYEGVVVGPTGRKYRAGTWPTEAAAWEAAQRLAAELRADAAA